MSIVGYDDVSMAALPFIDLTTVGQDVQATARSAVDCAVARLDRGDPRETTSSAPLTWSSEARPAGFPAATGDQ